MKRKKIKTNVQPRGPRYDRSWMHPFGYGLVDPTERPFDEWVDFIFNRPVPDSEWERLQIEDAGWAGDPERFLEYATQLFRGPEVLLSKYGAEQINQGFCSLLPRYGLWRWIWEKDINSKLRTECVISMVNVFERLFNHQNYKEAYYEACFMWWDFLDEAEANNPDARVKAAMLKTLSKILKIDSDNCQLSALHGLGHLEHPKKQEVIEGFLKSHRNIDSKSKRYALAAIDERVL